MDHHLPTPNEAELEELMAKASQSERQRMRKEIEAQESSKRASLESSK
jgi:hypothetical protein